MTDKIIRYSNIIWILEIEYYGWYCFLIDCKENQWGDYVELFILRWKRNKIGKNYFAKFETFSALRGIYKLGSVRRLDEAFYNEMKKKENLFCKILFYRLQSKNIILWKIQTLQIWAADRLGSCFLLIPASPDLYVAWILSLIIFFFVTRSFFFFAKANTRCY